MFILIRPKLMTFLVLMLALWHEMRFWFLGLGLCRRDPKKAFRSGPNAGEKLKHFGLKIITSVGLIRPNLITFLVLILALWHEMRFWFPGPGFCPWIRAPNKASGPNAGEKLKHFGLEIITILVPVRTNLITLLVSILALMRFWFGFCQSNQAIESVTPRAQMPERSYSMCE